MIYKKTTTVYFRNVSTYIYYTTRHHITNLPFNTCISEAYVGDTRGWESGRCTVRLYPCAVRFDKEMTVQSFVYKASKNHVWRTETRGDNCRNSEVVCLPAHDAVNTLGNWNKAACSLNLCTRCSLYPWGKNLWRLVGPRNRGLSPQVGPRNRGLSPLDAAKRKISTALSENDRRVLTCTLMSVDTHSYWHVQTCQ